MKKLLGGLALAVLGVGAFLFLRDRADAMPPQLSPVVRVVCDGNIQCCQGNGPRQFVYRVKVPSGGLVSVTNIEVGTHDPNLADYINRIMPAGWTLSILSASRPDPGFVCTPHGNFTSIASACPYILRFAGPAQTSNFTLAYDFALNWDVHDADWKASNGNRADWTKAVGLGYGPLHSPLFP